MEPKPYEELDPAELLALCIWREARSEDLIIKHGVAHVVLNRVKQAGWWGNTIHTVILKPWQFNSFNADDPNNMKWPEESDPDWQDSLSAAQNAIGGGDDVTDGATYYHDTRVDFPKSWGSEDEYQRTMSYGKLNFYKQV